jgi:hypothetical protein
MNGDLIIFAQKQSAHSCLSFFLKMHVFVFKWFSNVQFSEVARIVISVDILLFLGSKRRSNYYVCYVIRFF